MGIFLEGLKKLAQRKAPPPQPATPHPQEQPQNRKKGRYTDAIQLIVEGREADHEHLAIKGVVGGTMTKNALDTFTSTAYRRIVVNHRPLTPPEITKFTLSIMPLIADDPSSPIELASIRQLVVANYLSPVEAKAIADHMIAHNLSFRQHHHTTTPEQRRQVSDFEQWQAKQRNSLGERVNRVIYRNNYTDPNVQATLDQEPYKKFQARQARIAEVRGQINTTVKTVKSILNRF